MPRISMDIEQRRHWSMGQRIKRRRQELGLNQVQLSQSANISQGFLSAIERDLRTPGAATIRDLASALAVPPAVIIGQGQEHDNPQPLETRELPLFGSIPAGLPTESQESLEMMPVLQHLWAVDYYCLRLSFGSMEPTLKPGDIVLVHYRPHVDPLHVQGKICACLVDGQPTLKRVSVESHRGRRTIVLRGDNPDVKSIIIHENQDFSIQGVVLKLVAREL